MILFLITHHHQIFLKGATLVTKKQEECTLGIKDYSSQERIASSLKQESQREREAGGEKADTVRGVLGQPRSPQTLLDSVPSPPCL